MREARTSEWPAKQGWALHGRIAIGILIRQRLAYKQSATWQLVEPRTRRSEQAQTAKRAIKQRISDIESEKGRLCADAGLRQQAEIAYDCKAGSKTKALPNNPHEGYTNAKACPLSCERYRIYEPMGRPMGRWNSIEARNASGAVTHGA